MPINKKTTHKKEYLPNIILSYTNDKIIRRNKNENKKQFSKAYVCNTTGTKKIMAKNLEQTKQKCNMK